MSDISTIKELLKKPALGLVESLVKELRQVAFNRILEYQISEYKSSLITKTMLHRIKPVNLLDIYVPIILDEKNRYFDNFFLEDTGKKKYEIGQFDDVISLLKKYQFIYLNGIAGGGKTTLIKYFLIALIKKEFKIPIKIDLREFNSFQVLNPKNNVFFDFLDVRIFKFNGLSKDENITDRLLHKGKFVFLLDGLDELNSEIVQEVNKSLDDFCKKYDANHYILTSRPFTQSNSPVKFISLWVQDLSPESVTFFIKKQNFNKRFEADILKTINSIGESNYMEFLRNPLLLSMFVLTYHSYPNIPSKKHLYYSQVFEALFALHDNVSKKGFKRQIVSGLPKDEFQEVLNTISFISYFNQHFELPEDFLKDTLKEINNCGVSSKFDIENYIHDLTTSVNLLIKESGKYKYIHRSLQEYFAAAYVKELSSKNKLDFYTNVIDKIVSIDKKFISEFFNFYTLVFEMDEKDCIRLFEIPLITRLKNFVEGIRDSSSFYGKFFDKLILIKFFLGAKESISVRLSTSRSFYGEVEIKVADSDWQLMTKFLSKIEEQKRTIAKEYSFSENTIMNMVKNANKH